MKRLWDEHRRKIFALVAVSLVVAAILCRSQRTVIKPLVPGVGAERYVAEFQKMPFSEVLSETAPDGSAKVIDRNLAWLPFAFRAGCHGLRYIPREGQGRKILTARETDPGSGRSFSWGWSKDSKAIFIKGAHSGLDCRGESGHLGVIYTVEDGIPWGVPD